MDNNVDQQYVGSYYVRNRKEEVYIKQNYHAIGTEQTLTYNAYTL